MKWYAFLSAVLAVALAAGCTKPSDDARVDELTSRIEKLEAAVEKMNEIEEFIRPIMAQQKQQQEQELAREPDPEARFAVDVAGNAYDGPAGAPVTIIEAFDFA